MIVKPRLPIYALRNSLPFMPVSPLLPRLLYGQNPFQDSLSSAHSRLPTRAIRTCVSEMHSWKLMPLPRGLRDLEQSGWESPLGRYSELLLVTCSYCGYRQQGYFPWMVVNSSFVPFLPTDLNLRDPKY